MPLYVEEVIRALTDSGALKPADRGWLLAQPSGRIEVPDTLQGVILSRIDCLDEDLRRTAEMASVIGRIFAQRILAAACGSKEEVEAHLAELQRLDLVRIQRPAPEPEFIFKHVLIQDTIYGTLLTRKRRECHRRVASAPSLQPVVQYSCRHNRTLVHRDCRLFCGLYDPATSTPCASA